MQERDGVAENSVDPGRVRFLRVHVRFCGSAGEEVMSPQGFSEGGRGWVLLGRVTWACVLRATQLHDVGLAGCLIRRAPAGRGGGPGNLGNIWVGGAADIWVSVLGQDVRLEAELEPGPWRNPRGQLGGWLSSLDFGAF